MRKKHWITLSVAAAVIAGTATAIIFWRQHQRALFAEVTPGVLYRSRQLDRPQLERFIPEHGICTVVNLRTEEEGPEEFAVEQAACSALGARLMHIKLGTLPTDEEMLRFFRAFKEGGAVLVHCQLGRNRTGFFVACYRVVMCGWNADEAVKEMIDWGYPDQEHQLAPRTEYLRQLQSHRGEWLARLASGPTTTAATSPD